MGALPHTPARSRSTVLSQYGRENGSRGLLFPTSRGWSYTNHTPAAGVAYFARGVPSRQMLIVSIGFVVVTAGANVAVDVGLYDCWSGARLGSSAAGTGLLGTTGAKSINLSAPVLVKPDTVYYAALSCDTGTTAVLAGAGFLSADVPQAFATGFPSVEIGSQGAAHPLSGTSPLTTPPGHPVAVPALWAREF